MSLLRICRDRNCITRLGIGSLVAGKSFPPHKQRAAHEKQRRSIFRTSRLACTCLPTSERELYILPRQSSYC
ncbi:hypothetical protein KC362_g11 [Hortaea werneckii]|nr:hypothetical protein KC362_g11 [Hortaea werneckii]